ncbi:MAG: hypothetical protein AAGF86_18085 [Pseudomonadota bacterium]
MVVEEAAAIDKRLCAEVEQKVQIPFQAALRAGKTSAPLPARVLMCTACMKRGWQLRVALVLNLLTCMPVWNSVAFNVVFCSEDDEDDVRWILSRLERFLATGTLHVGVRRPGWQHWHTSKGKNVAHVFAMESALASHGNKVGRVSLANLDADNIVSTTFVGTLMESLPQVALTGIIQGRGDNSGCTGRIALPAQLFFRLGGYNEQMLPSGFQDIDLLHRTRGHGGTRVKWPRHAGSCGWSIPNDIQSTKRKSSVKIINCDPGHKLSWQQMNDHNMALSQRLSGGPAIIALLGGAPKHALLASQIMVFRSFASGPNACVTPWGLAVEPGSVVGQLCSKLERPAGGGDGKRLAKCPGTCSSGWCWAD